MTWLGNRYELYAEMNIPMMQCCMRPKLWLIIMCSWLSGEIKMLGFLNSIPWLWPWAQHQFSYEACFNSCINQQFSNSCPYTELFISANHIHPWESQHSHLYPAAECGNSSPAFPLCVWKWCWKARVHPRTRLQLMLVITSCQSHLISGMNSTISTARRRKREGKHNSFY